jgi:hypothetical protein
LNISLQSTTDTSAAAAAAGARGVGKAGYLPAAAAPAGDGLGAVLGSEVWAGGEGQLPPLAVAVLDEFGARVSGRQAGLMAVEAVAKCDVNSSSSSSSGRSDSCQLQGVVRVTPVTGVSHFPELTLQGRPGTSHELRFLASAKQDQGVSPGVTSAVPRLVSEQWLLVHLPPCGPGQATTSLGCNSCEAPTFSYSREGLTADSCSTCPEGVTEVCSMSVLVPADGYWHSGPRSAHIIPCPRPSACYRTPEAYQGLIGMQEHLAYEGLGNSTAAEGNPRGLKQVSLVPVTPSDQAYLDLLCAEGYKGHLCAQCSWDGSRDGVLYGLNLLGCRQCPSKAVAVLVYLACRVFDLLLVLLLVTVTLTERTRRKNATRTWQTTALLELQQQQKKQQGRVQQQEQRLAGIEEAPLERQEQQQQQHRSEQSIFGLGSSQTSGQTISDAMRLQAAPVPNAATTATDEPRLQTPLQQDILQQQQRGQEQGSAMLAGAGSEESLQNPSSSSERKSFLRQTFAFFLPQRQASQSPPPSSESRNLQSSLNQQQQQQEGRQQQLQPSHSQQQQQQHLQHAQHLEQRGARPSRTDMSNSTAVLPSFLQSGTTRTGSSSASEIPAATAPTTAMGGGSSRATSSRLATAPTSTTISFLTPPTSTAFPTPLPSSTTAAGTPALSSSGAVGVAPAAPLVSSNERVQNLAESESAPVTSTWSQLLRWFNQQHRWQAPTPSSRSLTNQSNTVDQWSTHNLVPAQQTRPHQRSTKGLAPVRGVAKGSAAVAAVTPAVAGIGALLQPGATAQLRWSTELQRLLLMRAPRAQLLELLPALLGVVVLGPLLEVKRHRKPLCTNALLEMHNTFVSMCTKTSDSKLVEKWILILQPVL